MYKALEIYLPKMWARVKLNRQKIMENYFKSSRSSPPNVFFSKGAHFFWRTHLKDCFWSFFWRTASGKTVKWQKSNGEHFQMLQKQSPGGVLPKRCLSFLKNTSGSMLLEFLKNRYIVRRGFLFLLSSQKNSHLFYKNLEK